MRLFHSPRRQTWVLFCLAWLIAGVGFFVAAERIGRNNALMQLLDGAQTDAALKTALLNVALERPRVLPLVLSGDPDVADALNGEVGAAQALSEKLAALIPGTEASVIYVTGADGRAISSSNWNSSDSFVGVDFSFREYYKVAMSNGRSEHYALGHVSNAPGLYIANRVDDPKGNKLGIVIAKVEFPKLEADWRIGRKPVYITDRNGVVLMTSVPEWRFHTTWPLDGAILREIDESRQFGSVELKPLQMELVQAPSKSVSFVRALREVGAQEEFMRLQLAVPSTSWTLNYLQPTQSVIALHVREMLVVTAATLMPLIVLSILWLRRRHRLEDIGLAAAEDRMKLETRVAERTQDLSAARDLLQFEIEQRRNTETALRQVQHRLVQANRLSILGQVAAGVAHEINQPVATIRTFADNSRKLLERGRAEDVVANLNQIASLTERIGKITSDLKILARKGRTAAQPVGLRSVIDGAVMLLQSRFSGHMNALSIDYKGSDISVLGSQIRLEQILINLLQNALEAVESQADGRVLVSVKQAADDMIALHVKDNGPGIDPEIMAQLFTPFNTSKEGGLGLGLVISSDIAADYGGKLLVETSDAGTCFIVLLKKASA
jgi:two-component system C4-dicarboxylate transport sensor histidine kinase DctB